MFEHLTIDWDDIVSQNREYYRPILKNYYDNVGSMDLASTLTRITGESQILHVHVTGQTHKTDSFAEKVRAEFTEFICNDEGKYQTLRGQVNTMTGSVGMVLTTMIASAISTSCGLLGSLVVPLVAILLKAATTMGINAWCQVNATS